MQPCFSFPTSGQWKAFLCILTKCKLSWPKSYLTQKTLWPRSFDHIQSRRIWSILPFFLSSALLCFFSWEVLGSWGLEPAAEVAYFFLPPADSSHRSGILEKALKETDGINTKKAKCSTKNKASPMHTKSDFWKWIKIMKFGQNCETLSKLKELLVFPICLFFLFKFTLNIDKSECIPIDGKSQRKFMTFSI